MTTTTIPAVSWQFEHDVDDAVSAGRFRAMYRVTNSGASMAWDDTIYAGVRIYQRQDTPDLVRVNMVIDGSTITIVEGVVDQHVLRDTPEGSTGQVVGRDKMALLLDRRPTGSFVYNASAFAVLPQDQFTKLITNPPSPDIANILPGAAIINGQPATNIGFIAAVTQLMQTVDVPVIVHPGVPDYKLGPSITITRDKSYAEYLAQLMRPLRLSEKHRVDAFVDPVSGVLHVQQRDNVPWSTVSMGHACVKDAEFEKSGLPQWPTVRFQGFSWRAPIRVQQGLPGVRQPVSLFEMSVDAGGLAYTLETVTWNDAAGNEVEKYEKKTYTSDSFNGDLANTVEETLTTTTYNEILGSASYGLVVEQLITVQKTTGSSGGPFLVSDTQVIMDYWPENIQPQTGVAGASTGSGFPSGSLKTKTTLEIYYSDSAPTLAFTKKTTTVETISQASNQLVRQIRTIIQDGSGNTTQTLKVNDLGPFKIVGGKGSPITPQGSVMTQQWILSGPIDKAGLPLPFVVSDDMVADQATADQIHDWLVDEYNSVKVRVRLSIQPDLRLRTGRNLTITGAPSYWPATTFYVTAIRAISRGMWEIQGTCWI